MPHPKDTPCSAGKMKGSHRKCEEAPKKYDENRRASSSFGMLNGMNAAYGKGRWKGRTLKRFKRGTVILCGDKGICKTAHGYDGHSLRNVCTFRDYFAPSGLVPPSAGRTDSTGMKYTPCGVCALSWTTLPLRGSCRRKRRGEPTARA